jgi:predicted ATPase
MAKKESQVKLNSASAEKGITKITVAGYKSISQEQSIEIRPLTILAGANSSGKSSMMQPLLLLKQTLEASYDPGALRLDGPNVRFTSADQFLSRSSKRKHCDSFDISIELENHTSLSLNFCKPVNSGVEVDRMTFASGDEKVYLLRGMTNDEIRSEALRGKTGKIIELVSSHKKIGNEWIEIEPQWMVTRNRCFLELAYRFESDTADKDEGYKTGFGLNQLLLISNVQGKNIEPHIRELIHLPGLRGNPERTYLVASVTGSFFPGTFENYVASVIAKWQVQKNDNNLESLSQDLKEAGLTWRVAAKPINDTQVELQVGRLPQSSKAGKSDMVSIADVGVGVSQTLPVLVALHAAKPGQLVYIEQPEIHLHPRAQTAMAHILAKAAKRGVRVVVETHSSLLILGIQTLVAEGEISPELIKLHWFERRNGRTQITSRDLDETGAFGDWPEDFADVALEAQSRYLDAAESRMRSKRRAS